MVLISAIFNETFCYTMHEWLVNKYVSLVGEWSRNNEAFARTHKYFPGMAIFLSLNIDYHLLRSPTLHIITTFFMFLQAKLAPKSIQQIFEVQQHKGVVSRLPKYSARKIFSGFWK